MSSYMQHEALEDELQRLVDGTAESPAKLVKCGFDASEGWVDIDGNKVDTVTAMAYLILTRPFNCANAEDARVVDRIRVNLITGLRGELYGTAVANLYHQPQE